MLKKWMTILVMAMLIFAPTTAEARGFGGHSFSRSSYSSHYSSPFSSHSSGLFGSSKSSSGLFGSRSSSSGSYRTYARPMSGFHFGSFGLGMLMGGLFHPFGGYYGMGGYYGYHPFGFFRFIFDLFILWIIFRIIRSFFRR